jgi:hypothetical protein
MSNALEGLRQFYSETVGIAVIPADQLAEIAAQSFDAAELVSACLKARDRDKAPLPMRCSGCSRHLNEVAAYLFVFLKPVQKTEYHFLCAKCGYSDGRVQAVVDRLTKALRADGKKPSR